MKKRLSHIILSCVAAAMTLSIPAASQTMEYRIKALLVEKFALFTEWNSSVKGESFVIAVLGVSPFNGELEDIASRTKIKNKPVRVVYIDDVHDAKECHLLFICASEKRRVSGIVRYARNLNILTVSDSPGFCSQGVHLNFYVDDAKTIKYEINPVSITKSNLTVELQLLNYGKITE